MKFILIILDGFGLRDSKDGNAYALAKTPTLDNLLTNKPMATLEASGSHVGLPDGIMGNSEVGHTNIGAGRIVKQDFVSINESIKQNSLKDNKNLISTFEYVLNNNSTLHIMGLLSDGGVHSHINHFKYIINAAKDMGIEDVVIHPFTDGRDTSPKSGKGFLISLNNYIKEIGVGSIGTICGRYYAMDRDNRWERIQAAYKMLVDGEGEIYDDFDTFINDIYKNETDEFIKPSIIGQTPLVKNGDAILSINFRSDRMRATIYCFY